MRVIKTQKGFTIVETLIVLAVTGFLFVSTMFLISGQVSNAQYRDTVYRVNQAIQNSINDVQNGVFNPQNNSCSDGKDAGKSDCVYVGIKITIKDNGTMLKEYLQMPSALTAPALVSDMTPFYSSTINLPKYVVYATNEPSGDDLEFYVLFTNYKQDTVDLGIGGAQGYTIKYPTGGGSPTLKKLNDPGVNKRCLFLKSGSRSAKITVGDDGRLETIIEFEPGSTSTC